MITSFHQARHDGLVSQTVMIRVMFERIAWPSLSYQCSCLSS
jgi:hypothetical protein